MLRESAVLTGEISPQVVLSSPQSSVLEKTPASPFGKMASTPLAETGRIDTKSLVINDISKKYDALAAGVARILNRQSSEP